MPDENNSFANQAVEKAFERAPSLSEVTDRLGVSTIQISEVIERGAPLVAGKSEGRCPELTSEKDPGDKVAFNLGADRPDKQGIDRIMHPTAIAVVVAAESADDNGSDAVLPIILTRENGDASLVNAKVSSQELSQLKESAKSWRAAHPEFAPAGNSKKESRGTQNVDQVTAQQLEAANAWAGKFKKQDISRSSLPAHKSEPGESIGVAATLATTGTKERNALNGSSVVNFRNLNPNVSVNLRLGDYQTALASSIDARGTAKDGRDTPLKVVTYKELSGDTAIARVIVMRTDTYQAESEAVGRLLEDKSRPSALEKLAALRATDAVEARGGQFEIENDRTVIIGSDPAQEQKPAGNTKFIKIKGAEIPPAAMQITLGRDGSLTAAAISNANVDSASYAGKDTYKNIRPLAQPLRVEHGNLANTSFVIRGRGGSPDTLLDLHGVGSESVEFEVRQLRQKSKNT